MGGGGGGGYYPRGPTPSERARTAEAESSYNAQVAEYLRDTLAVFNDRPTDVIASRVEAIRSALEDELEAAVPTLFGGSVKKHTYVDGLSDVDVLFILNETELTGSPEEALRFLATKISERFPNSEVKNRNTSGKSS